ncbi:MAG: sigma-70 family RNA polymerase sigma factor [Alicyclobacillus sp.]|nr:sigma-70 family RNA polymerase sigma factor [Alicyclobacillus sp.]
MSDEELFSRIKQGDGEALSLLYDRYAMKVARIAHKWIRDQQGMEEVVQDVFTRVWTTQSFTPEKGQFGNWIAVVTRRITIDYLRKSGRLLDIPDSERLESIGDMNRLDHQLQRKWLRQDLVGSMENLRADERVILELAYFKGHSLSEIATLLNIPLGTVKTQLHSALKNMKKSMEDWSAEA